jgi:hypothetical protein
MAHSYRSDYPRDVGIAGGIRPFFERFYQTSDDPAAHEAYADFFADDATFILASTTARGREGRYLTLVPPSRLSCPVILPPALSFFFLPYPLLLLFLLALL